MRLIENVTKIKHTKFGIGIYKETIASSQIILVVFPCGEKKLSMDAFKMGIISIIEDELIHPTPTQKSTATKPTLIGNMMQFDSSPTKIGKRNVLEAFSTDNSILFNESYTIIGEEMIADTINACYDLTIIGNLKVKKIEVKGSLTVLGDIEAEDIICPKTLFSSGSINATTLEVGGDLIAESIKKCSNLYCNGSVIVQKSVDLEDSEIDKVILAGEGIVGSGSLSTQYGVAVEYFEYDGNIHGKIIELDTNTTIDKSGAPSKQDFVDFSYSSLIEDLTHAISSEINKCGEQGEEAILAFAKELQTGNPRNLEDWHTIFSLVINISYSDRIDNLLDFLILFYAKKILPKEMLDYESVEHIFKTPYIEAQAIAHTLPFQTHNVREFILALKILTTYDEELNLDKEDTLDKIFQSIGIKYKTVKSFFVSK